MAKPRRLIDRKGLREKGINYTDTHLKRLIDTGRFPKPFKFVDGGKNHWFEDAIDEYIAARVAIATETEAA